MINKNWRFTAAVMSLLALGAGSVAMATGETGSSAQAVRCEIEATSDNGMIALRGIVHAEMEISGSYRFRVVSAGDSGNTNIGQGGNFTAGPGRAATLGKVMLGGTGAVYDANLEITSNSTTIECAERVGGAI